MLKGEARARYVQGMFTRIAHNYDCMNRLMTFGQDRRWRREVIHRTVLPPRGVLLDLGTGTGDLAFEALRQFLGCRVIASDFTVAMMRVGQARYIGQDLEWVSADALRLPFNDSSFDALVSGFLLRNVSNIGNCLAEMYRVLKPGGRVVALDTTHPPAGLLSPIIHMYMHRVIPALGRLLAGESDAYTYLPESTESFLQAEILTARFLVAGFHDVGFRRLMFATVAIHWGEK